MIYSGFWHYVWYLVSIAGATAAFTSLLYFTVRGFRKHWVKSGIAAAMIVNVGMTTIDAVNFVNERPQAAGLLILLVPIALIRLSIPTIVSGLIAGFVLKRVPHLYAQLYPEDSL